MLFISCSVKPQRAAPPASFGNKNPLFHAFFKQAFKRSIASVKACSVLYFLSKGAGVITQKICHLSLFHIEPILLFGSKIIKK